MKFRWDKKYLYWGMTGLFVLIGGIAFYYLIFHNNTIRSGLSNILRIAMPIIDGLIVAYLLSPIVNFLESRIFTPIEERLKKRFPSLAGKEKKISSYKRGLSILITLAFVLLAVYGFIQFVIPQLASSLQNIVMQFPVYVNNLTQWLAEILANNPKIETSINELISTYSKDLEDWLNKMVMPQMNNVLKTVSLSMISLAKALWNLVIGLIISIYLMANKERFIGQMKKCAYAFFPVNRANSIIEDARLIDRTFGGFINGKILDSIIIGIICFVCVTLMNLPYPMLISVIVGLTNIIPFFGPFIGAVPCALLILMVNPLQCLYFIIFIFILQQFDGNFLGPRILGSSTGLSGFWVIFSITIFSGIMGVPGMILGVPIFAVFYALLKRRINKNLRKKGLSQETEDYQELEKVDQRTGEFVRMEHEAEGNPQGTGMISHMKKMFTKKSGQNKREK